MQTDEADLLVYLRCNGVISKQQHGFLSRRSTSTNLLEVLRDWTLAINDMKGVHVAYIDYAGAFDTVSHAKLFHKLTAYSITATLLDWIKSLLSERTQQTRIGNSVSCSTVLTSGVIQGSVLGTLLFILFVNDLPDVNK